MIELQKASSCQQTWSGKASLAELTNHTSKSNKEMKQEYNDEDNELTSVASSATMRWNTSSFKEPSLA